MVEHPKVQVSASVYWSEPWLPRFLAQLGKQDYPKDCIRYAFSASPGKDGTVGILLDWLKDKPNFYVRCVPSKPEWPARRRMWNAGNYFRRHALEESPETWRPDYVFVCDTDVITMPPNLISFLVSKDVDVVAPYVYVSEPADTGRSNGTFYDGYGFRFLYGPYDYTRYPQPPWWADWYKGHIEDPSVRADLEKRLIPMQSVGVNPVMYKRQVLEKVYYDGDEAIFGFCKAVVAAGFKVWSTPDVETVHSHASIYGRLDV